PACSGRCLRRRAAADGVADWALVADSLARAARVLRGLGHAASGPIAMHRERPDGERLAWELLLPESPLHPFRIADVTPRSRRVSADAAAVAHANGARRIAAVLVRAPVPAIAALELGDALGVVPRLEDEHASVIELGSLKVEVLAGGRTGAAAVRLAGTRALPADVTALG